MEKTTKPQLKADIRLKSSDETRRIRRSGFIPGIVYGKGIPNVLVKIESDAFQKIFSEAGEHTLVDLKLENKDSRTVLIHDVALDSIKGTPVHVDFYQVRLDEAVRTEIPLTFEGVSKAVKDLEGTLVKAMNSVEIEALPADIPHKITVDISPLKTFENHILVKDIQVDSRVKILANLEEIVASVVPPRSQEELEELEEAVVEDVEAIEGVKKEDEKQKGAEIGGDQKEEKTPTPEGRSPDQSVGKEEIADKK